MSPPASNSILIVGGNRGIGFGLVKDSLKRDSTTTVFATARDPEKADALTMLVKQYPSRLTVLKLDMLDESSVMVAVTEFKKRKSTLDTIIINAGIATGVGRIEDLSAADFLENLEGNIVGPHNITKAFSPLLLESKSAKRTLAYISSGMGSVTASAHVAQYIKRMFQLDFVPKSGYAVTKSGLNMLGRQWADSLEPKGVAVLLISPGAVSTDMNKGQGEGLITVEESAKGVLDVVAKSTIEDAGKAILSYDGATYPW